MFYLILTLIIDDEEGDEAASHFWFKIFGFFILVMVKRNFTSPAVLRFRTIVLISTGTY